MAKNKNQVELIPMYKCVQSLEELNTRLSLLLNIIPDAIRYIKDNPSGNEKYQEFLISILEGHYNKVIEAYRSQD